MKLSEAMRKGAELRPKAEGAFFLWKVAGAAVNGEYFSCALGAAYEGATGKHDLWSADFRKLHELFPDLGTTDVTTPAGTIQPLASDLETVVIYLNDNCGWSRERIADWLEQQGW